MFHQKQAQATFFANPIPVDNEQALWAEVDLTRFIIGSKTWAQKNLSEEIRAQWHEFTQHLLQKDTHPSEKLILLKISFKALKNPVEPGELAQLLTLSGYIKDAYGTRLFRSLFSENSIDGENCLRNYLISCQLLLDLQDEKDIIKIVEESLPSLDKLVCTLREKHSAYLASKYPKRKLEDTIARFVQKNELVQFPLTMTELEQLQAKYRIIESLMPALKTPTQTELQLLSKNHPSHEQRIAIIIETVQRVFKIAPHDTQLLGFLALINSGEDFRGRIGQIKTGEGKSLIIAMLAAYQALQGKPVDVVTSSPYLAQFASRTNAPFFAALGLTTSHICHKPQKSEHFAAHIVYGTNTDFEFAMLRDGIHNLGLRQRPYWYSDC